VHSTQETMASFKLVTTHESMSHPLPSSPDKVEGTRVGLLQDELGCCIVLFDENGGRGGSVAG